MDRDEVDRQLELAWQAFTPSSGLSAQVRGRLAATGIVPLPPPRGLAGANAPSGWRALRASGRHGVGLGLVLVAAGFVLGRVTPTASTTRPAPGLAAPTAPFATKPPTVLPLATPGLPPALPQPLASRESSVSKEGATSKAGPTQRRARSPGGVAPKPSAQRDWRGELELLERAERSVRADNAALALALLQEHDTNYPSSVLIEERRAIELMAHCQARATDGSARATRFLADYPRSVYADRVIALCGLDDSPEKRAIDGAPLKDPDRADIKSGS